MNWPQLWAIIWLRWRLSRNQFLRAGQLNAALSILMLVMMLLITGGLAVGAGVLGWYLGAKQPSPPLLLAVFDGAMFAFLIFWFSGLMVEIQRSESLDLEKLMRLPVTLQQVFVFNYAASHFTPSIIIMMPALLSLSLGLAIGGGAMLLLIVPAFLSFMFACTAWTYCLRGWLAGLMVNKRRRRAVMVWVTIVFVLIAQAPNLIFNSRFFRQRARSAQTAAQPNNAARAKRGANTFEIPEPLLAAHIFIPPAWPGYSAMNLREHHPLPALGTSAAAMLLGVLGLMRAYRLTLRFYLGAEAKSGTVPATVPNPGAVPAATATAPPGILLVERRIRWLRDDTAALTLATLRSLLRAPEVKMALIMPIVMGAIMLSVYFSRPKHPIPPAFSGLITVGAVAAAVFCLVPTMSNMFGLDRGGFRSLVLLPTERDRILLAKNLAVFPFLVGVTLVLLLMVKLVIGIPWGTFLAGLLQAPTAFLLFCLLTNYVSILAPYRLAQGTLQAKKPKAVIFVAVFASLVVLPFLMIPIMVPPLLQLLAAALAWPSFLPVNLLSTALILAGVLWLYRGMLPVQGRLLQRREQIILREVTEEIE